MQKSYRIVYDFIFWLQKLLKRGLLCLRYACDYVTVTTYVLTKYCIVTVYDFVILVLNSW